MKAVSVTVQDIREGDLIAYFGITLRATENARLVFSDSHPHGDVYVARTEVVAYGEDQWANNWVRRWAKEDGGWFLQGNDLAHFTRIIEVEDE